MRSDSGRIRVLTVDDHALLRQGIAALINGESDMKGWDAVLALLVRGDAACCAGVSTLHNHPRAGNCKAGGIGDQTGQLGVLGF